MESEGEMKNVPADCLTKGGIGPISSSESALKLTYGNVDGQKKCSPAVGFCPH